MWEVLNIVGAMLEADFAADVDFLTIFLYYIDNLGQIYNLMKMAH